MPVKAIGEYIFPAANRLENYGGDINIYVGWDHHLMMPCPSAYRIPPGFIMREFLEQFFRPDYEQHPDTAKLDFDSVEWTYEEKPWYPALDKSLAENGVTHMAYLRFRTPALNGLNGTGN